LLFQLNLTQIQIKGWSVSSESGGNVKWDTTDTKKGGSPGSEGMSWDEAVSACTITGGRLPTVEELKSLKNTYGTTPLNMLSDYYWSLTAAPTDFSVWIVNMNDGDTGSGNKERDGGSLLRCVH